MRNTRWILAGVVTVTILIFIAGVLIINNRNITPVPTQTNPSGNNHVALSQPTTNNDQTSDTGDSSLDNSINTLDTKLNNLNNDTYQIDGALNQQSPNIDNLN